MIGGATGWEDIQTYGESHAAWLGTFLSLPAGIPSADTYRRVFERLDPQAVRAMFPGLGRPDCRGHWGTGYPH